MLIKERVEEIIEKAGNRSPIFFGDLHFTILKGRQKIRGVADKVVMKGTEKEILNNKRAKRAALLHYFGGTKEAKKKVHNFDLDKIKLTKTVFKKFLGYGVVEGEKGLW